MSLRTSLTELFSIQHPIVLAPMGGSAGGALAAAVSNAGGLGLVGGGRSDHDWLDRELTLAAERTDRPWGVGLQSWAARTATVERVLAHRPHAVMLSFGDASELATPVKQAGVKLIMQVTDLDEANQAVRLGADVIVAQGAEAGGHGGGRATLPFVPVVVDLVEPTPVLAAGGIADGRGVAAALALGAAGALIGTRFLATFEALIAPEAVRAILDSTGEDTERSRVLDIALDTKWPARYTARTLRNAFLDQWRGREDALDRDQAAKDAYQAAVAHGAPEDAPVWASQAIDLITQVSPAADLVHAIAREAEAALGRAASSIRPA
jgi:nitronate monooxygenase